MKNNACIAHAVSGVKKPLSLLKCLLVMISLLVVQGVFAQTLSTDQADYAPNSWATITGTGFLPGETVVVQVVDYSFNGQLTNGDNSVNPLHQPFEVIADDNGEFSTIWYVGADESGMTLKATANGMQSGFSATHFFTDATPIIGWSPTGLTTYGPSPWAPTTLDANLTMNSGLTRGAGVGTGGTAASGAWGGSMNTANLNTSALAITNNQFVTFSFTPKNGFLASLSTFDLFYRRSGSGPANGLLQYSINGGAYADIATLDFTNSTSTGAAISTVSLSGIAALQSIPSTNTVGFRLVLYNNTTAGGTFYVYTNGLNIGGAVTSSSFSITSSAGSNGSISPNGTTTVSPGGSQTFTISPNSGYVVSNVLVDGNSVGAVTSYTFSNVTASHSISASFIPGINYIYHEATTNSIGCGGINFRSASSVTSSGSMTIGWKIEYQFNSTNTALYYTTDGSTPSGSKGVGSGTTSVIAGSYNCTFNSGQNVDVVKATIPAQAAGKTIKYIIGAWNSGGGNELFANSGNCSGCGAITSSSSATVFSYTVVPTISAIAGTNGSISPSGSTQVTSGGNVTYTITANSGYYIANVLADNVSVGSVSSYTFNNVTTDHTISAIFVPLINYVFHEASTNTIGCNGNTFRSIQTPDNTQSETIGWKIEYQFGSTNTALYYTTDGSTPAGSKGVASGTTQVVNGSYNCTFNVGGLVVDVAKATIPAQPAGTTVKYIIGAWNAGGGYEVFASSGACSVCTPITQSSAATLFSYTVNSTTVDYANLQFPPTATISTGGSVTAYAQVYTSGVTEAAGASAGISGWIGYSTSNTDPGTWTNWVPATFNVQSGNNDEYKATFGSALLPGTYYYASRFQLTGGPYRYGGYSASGGGFWDGTNNVSGVLTVNCTTPAAPTISASGSLTFCSGGSVTLTSSAASGNTWSTGATTQSITVNASGNYTVSYKDGFGCTSATSAVSTVSVTPTPATPAISAGGPTTFCSGGSVTLTSSNPSGNVWSTGETTQSIVVTTAGSYTVTTSVNGCPSATSAATNTVVNSFGGAVTAINETVGTGNSILVNNYTGWSSPSPAAFSSTDGVTDIRSTSVSSGYTGVSGGSNVFLGISGTTNRNFSVSGINTTGLTSPVLSFGLHRDNTNAGITVEVSSDGISYSPLTITQPALANTWTLTTASGTIPSTNNLRIRFSKNNGTSFRIDDIKLTGTNSAAAISQAPGCNGAVTLTASQGSSYAWSTGAGTRSISVNATGTYSVTVTSSNGCTSSAGINVTDLPSALSASIATQTDVSCFGGSNGSVTFNVSGGTQPYSATTFSNLAAGTATYTITDATGCSVQTPQVTIVQPSAALQASGSITAPLCNGGTGTVTVSATGGTAPYNGTGAFQVAAGAPYSYTVTDANGCSSIVSGTMSNPAQVVATSTFTPITCFGGTSTVTVSANGGAGNYTGTGNFTVNAGSYSYIVTDGNGCTATTSGNISQPSQVTITESITNATCNGSANGAIAITVGGGTPAEGAVSAAITEDFNTLASTGTSTVAPSLSGAYQWAFLETGSNSNTSYTANDGSLGTGDTYSYGAVNSTERALGGLQSGSLLPFIGVKITNNTSKTVTAIDVNYFGEQWRLGSNGRNDRLDFQYSLNAASLGTGTWTDFNGLDFVAPVSTGTAGALNGNLAQNRSQVNGTITGLNLAPGATIWFGWRDFDATSSDDGLAVDDFTYTLKGLTDYTYSWSKNNTVIGTTKNLSDLTAGEYTVTVKDGNNCSASKTITVGEPAPLVVTATPGAIACNGGSTTVAVSATGGTAPYTGTGTFSNIAAGTYTYTVTDAKGCSSSATITISQPDALSTSQDVTACDSYVWTINNVTYTASGSYTAVTQNEAGCSVTNTLNLTINKSTVSEESATACDSYTWHGTTYTASGDYTYESQNAAGCTNTATLHLTINKSTTSEESATACDSYTWHGTTYTASGDYTYESQNVAGCTNTATLHLTINKSTTSEESATACDGYTWHGTIYTASGDYTYESQNAAGCTNTATLHLTINKSTTSEENATACDSYTWHGTTYTASGDYTYESQNAAGCTNTAMLHLTINKSTTSEESATACDSYIWHGTTYTASGDYTYESQNAAGCTNTATLHLTINKSTTSEESATACDSYIWHGTTYTASGDYTYESQNAAGCTNTATLHLTINKSTTSEESATACDSYTWHGITYTASGDYTYESQNAAGCTNTATLHLTINKSTTSEESATACDSYTWHGITYTASGDYTYASQNAAGCTNTATLHLTINRSTSNTTTKVACTSYTWPVNGETYTNAGTYTVTSTNAAGCMHTEILVLTIDPAINFTVAVTQPKCYGDKGAVILNASGGTGTITFGTTPVTNLSAGTYTYTATDGIGCPVSKTVVINEAPAAVVATAVVTQPKCYGESGSVVVSATGGSGSYNGTGTFTVAAGASYHYTVSDANGCTSNTVSGTINAPTAITSAISSQTNVVGSTLGSATVSASGGTGSYTYSWSPYGGTGAAATGLSAGTYNVTITDGNNCTKVQQVVITQTAVSNLVVTCGNTNGQLYFGYTGDQTSTVSGTPAGGQAPYTVEITMHRPLICNYINSSGNEVWTAQSGSNITSGYNTCATNTQKPFSRQTGIAAGGSFSVNVSLLDSAYFTVTVKDALGNTATCNTIVRAEDVRCFAGNSGITKVTLCHKTGNTKQPCVAMCVDADAVAAHLAHGDFLGKCTSNCTAPASYTSVPTVLEPAVTGLEVRVMNNPSVSNVPFRMKVLSNNDKDVIQLRVMDGTGKPVEYKPGLKSGQTIEIGRTYIQGMYFVEVLQGSQRKMVKLVKG